MLVIVKNQGLRVELWSYAERPWTAALSRFDLQGSKAADLLTELVSRCLDEFNELFSV